ncbi:hypothetical protein POBR111598_09890 [Polynucleobacter brandtiae]
MAPAKVFAAVVMVKVFAPKATTPELLPAKLTIETLLPEMALISKAASTVMAEEAAMAPLPVKYKVPAVIEVAPVYPLAADNVNEPLPDLLRLPLPVLIALEIVVLPTPVTVNAILLAPTLPSTLKVPPLETLKVVGAARVIEVSKSPIILAPPST